MKRTYSIATNCPFGYDGTLVVVVYTVSWGAPEQGPSYASGGQPADPDEVELVRVEPWVGSLPGDMQETLDRWASEWLADEGFSIVIEHAHSHEEEAREYAAELRADQ